MARNNLPFISIIIPCRNEEKLIRKCLDSLLSQDYPKEKMEVLVVNGMSEDGTREILEKYAKQYPFIKLMENTKKYIPFALNIGIRKARGEIIMRMDAHTAYEKDYVSKCVKYLSEYNADNVGGIWKITPRDNTVVARAIALSLSHPFGAGNAHYRIGSEKPRWVDTVPFFCCKKEVFERIGLFNENLLRSEDMEFNLRLKKIGGKILLFPDIVAYYYPCSNFRNFFWHNFKDGTWAIYPLKFVKIPLRLRHYIPFLFVLSLLGTGLLGIFFTFFFWLFLLMIGLYFFINLYFSVKIAMREKDLRYFFLLPIVFATRHFGYGLGSIWGLIKTLI